MSDAAKGTVNPLRAITDAKNKINPDKAVLNLSIGMQVTHSLFISYILHVISRLLMFVENQLFI